MGVLALNLLIILGNVILEVGGSLDFMQQYIKFRGGKPKIEGLLKAIWNCRKSFLNWVKCLQYQNKA